jgi:uncharacterized protein (DUF58 family)
VSSDPVRQRREQAARLASLARRAGWSLLGLAIIAFVFGLVVGLTGVIVVLVVGALALGSAFLLPAIIVGFGVSAAERDDPGGEGRPMEPWS